MRPVLLEMDGFASFRQKTVVDFDDVDYFVLVGATGAGKSTVIDAIAFSLYGSVARWDDARAVEPALAPTVNVGSVRLVFDVRGERYQIVRKLQRNAAGTVQQKTAQLERLLDPAARGEIDDDAELVAGGIRETCTAIEELLGLDFDQFTKCVALPQGEFAEFLHAKPGDRDKILTKLLGLDGYIRLGKVAGARAKHMRTRAETLTAQLAEDLVRCDDAALNHALTSHDVLKSLSAQVDDDVLRLAEQASKASAAADEQRRYQQALTLLNAVVVPDGLDTLDAALTSAREAADSAATAVRDAETADHDARAVIRAHPARAELERTRDQHLEAAQLDASATGVAARVTASGKEQATRLTARDTGKQRAQQTQQAATTATAAVERASAQLDATTAQLELLEAAQAPSDLVGLLDDVQVAASLASSAVADVSSSKDALTAAQASADALPDPIAIERASSTLGAVVQAARTTRSALAAVTGAHQEAAKDAATAERVAAEHAQAQATAGALQERAVAADLRAHLAAGDDCPVCEQTVTAIPGPLDAGDADLARKHATAVGSQLGAAQTAAARSAARLDNANAAASTALAALAAARDAASTALGALPGETVTVPSAPAAGTLLKELDPSSSLEAVGERVGSLDAATAELLEVLTAVDTTVTAAQERRAAADAAVRAAARAVSVAETAVAAAQQAQADLAAREQRARATLRTARDPLVALGAPAVDDNDLAAAWTALTDWAEQTRSATLATKTVEEKEVETAREAHTTALAAASAAERDLATTSEAYEQAVRDHEQALAAQTQHRARLAELTASLAAAPALAAVSGQLKTLAQLEAAAAAAEAQLVAARTGRDSAVRALQDLDEKQQAARAALTAARDPLVALGAPALPDTLTLTDAWATLTDWARAQATIVQADLDAVTATVHALTAALAAADTALRDRLAAAGIDTTDSARTNRAAAQWAQVAVAAATEAAAAEIRAIQDARARSEKTQQQIRALTEQAEVAAEVARLLHTDGFPRWLSRSALEVLVTAASETLMTLSGGQFELDLANTDAASFTVIDHSDADAVRPVKTLSGGETFQASLSLALALSTHLGALASNGAAQLDAIFIDEGFGTLDENTLDTVASTLETLATAAGRMVGVITHVPALANRVPVRFKVHRDPRGSSITRVNAGDVG